MVVDLDSGLGSALECRAFKQTCWSERSSGTQLALEKKIGFTPRLWSRQGFPTRPYSRSSNNATPMPPPDCVKALPLMHAAQRGVVPSHSNWWHRSMPGREERVKSVGGRQGEELSRSGQEQ